MYYLKLLKAIRQETLLYVARIYKEDNNDQVVELEEASLTEAKKAIQ
jgi:hypothetical protein